MLSPILPLLPALPADPAPQAPPWDQAGAGGQQPLGRPKGPQMRCKVQPSCSGVAAGVGLRLQSYWDAGDSSLVSGVHCTGAYPNIFSASAVSGSPQGCTRAAWMGTTLNTSSVGRQEGPGHAVLHCRITLHLTAILGTPRSSPTHPRPCVKSSNCFP